MTARRQPRRAIIFGGILLLAGEAIGAQTPRTYVGAETCVKCHEAESHLWAGSRHKKMMQAATVESVEGTFSGQTELRGVTYRFERRGGKFYISDSDGAGKQWEHRVDYTLGTRLIQHYLTIQADGQIEILPATWDVVRKKWIDAADAENPEESAEGMEVWNKGCYACHVSRGEKNFDLAKLSYHTSWQSLGVDCESCHGPGSEHVARGSGTKTRNGKVLDADLRVALRETIVNPARLDATRSTMICAECHSLRDAYAAEFTAGANYYDAFLPVMEYRWPNSDDAPYFADGRPRWFANEAVALWESQCFLKGGATCASCHKQAHQVDVDGAQLRSATNEACMGCHKEIAANIAGHTHHAATSAGSSCVECHMPKTVVSVRAQMRDHSISVPAPLNTLAYKIPNACNACHKDKDAEWAVERMKIWYGGGAESRLVRRADAFARARNGDGFAVPELLQIMKDDSESAFIRANAAGYLGGFPNDPRAYDAVMAALGDAQPLVRATAEVAIRPRAAQREAVAPKLVGLLGDPVATVRVSAVTALVAMGATRVPPQDEERFAEAKELYRRRAELNADDAQQQLAAGRFFLLADEAKSAVTALRATMKLDPAMPVQLDLARALAAAGDVEQARGIIATIPRDDRQYAAAQEFLAGLEAKDTGTDEAGQGNAAAGTGENEGRASFVEGQLSYRKADYGAALAQLERALRVESEAEWAKQARIYRAVCLEKLGRTQEAEDAMKALANDSEARRDVDLQLAYAELLDETGRPDEALKRADDVIAGAPRVGMAYWWRAKVLLELGRVSEAATAGEECVRLIPDAPAAHNLLLRIYQMQGRSKEAAEQAAWLREYQRRLESR